MRHRLCHLRYHQSTIITVRIIGFLIGLNISTGSSLKLKLDWKVHSNILTALINCKEKQNKNIFQEQMKSIIFIISNLVNDTHYCIIDKHCDSWNVNCRYVMKLNFMFSC